MCVCVCGLCTHDTPHSHIYSTTGSHTLSCPLPACAYVCVVSCYVVSCCRVVLCRTVSCCCMYVSVCACVCVCVCVCVRVCVSVFKQVL